MQNLFGTAAAANGVCSSCQRPPLSVSLLTRDTEPRLREKAGGGQASACRGYACFLAPPGFASITKEVSLACIRPRLLVS